MLYQIMHKNDLMKLPVFVGYLSTEEKRKIAKYLD